MQGLQGEPTPKYPRGLDVQGFKGQGFGCRLQALGLWAQASELRVQDFDVQGAETLKPKP